MYLFENRINERASLGLHLLVSTAFCPYSVRVFLYLYGPRGIFALEGVDAEDYTSDNWISFCINGRLEQFSTSWLIAFCLARTRLEVVEYLYSSGCGH